MTADRRSPLPPGCTKEDDGRIRLRKRHPVTRKHLNRLFATQTEAREFLEDLALEARNHREGRSPVTGHTRREATVAAYFAEWIDRTDIRPRELRRTSKMTYRAFQRNHLAPTALGALRLTEVTDKHYDVWARSRATLIGAYNLRTLSGALRSMFTVAIEVDRIITGGNPVPKPRRRYTPAPSKSPALVDYVPLTVAQVRAWAEAARPHIRAMILTQAMLGLRVGEVMALRVQDIQFLGRSPHVRILGQLGRYEKGIGPQRLPRKNDKPYKVPLPAELITIINEHMRRFPPLADGSVFATQYRHPMSHSRQWELYHEAATKAGLPDGTSSHDLRHHYVSLLFDAGLSAAEVAARIGDTLEVVMHTYAHMMPDREDRTAEAISAAWAGTPAATKGRSSR